MGNSESNSINTPQLPENSKSIELDLERLKHAFDHLCNIDNLVNLHKSLTQLLSSLNLSKNTSYLLRSP